MSPTERKPTPPRIQNIPIRTDTGRRIREAFQTQVPLTSADYTQVELRILAQLRDG